MVPPIRHHLDSHPRLRRTHARWWVALLVSLSLLPAPITHAQENRADPNLAATALTEYDLPRSYFALPPHQIAALFPNDPEFEGMYRPEVQIGFYSYPDDAMLLALAGPYISSAGRLAFDFAARSPDMLAELMESEDVWGPGYSGYASFDASEVGDAAIGITARFDPRFQEFDQPVAFAPRAVAPQADAMFNVQFEFRRMDMVMFRRGDIEVDLALIYLDGAEPPLDLLGLAQVWDERLLAALGDPTDAEREPEAAPKSKVATAPNAADEPVRPAPLITLDDLPEGFVAAPRDLMAPLFATADPTGMLAEVQLDVYMQLVADPTVVIAAVLPVTEADIAQIDAFAVDPAMVEEVLENTDTIPGALSDFARLEVESTGAADMAAAFRLVITPDAGAAVPLSVGDTATIDFALARLGSQMAMVVIVWAGERAPAVTLAKLLPVMEERLTAARQAPAGIRNEPAPLETETAPASIAVVAVKALTVRSGPGIVFPSVGAVHKGDELEVIDAQHGCRWLHIVAPDGLHGWVLGGMNYITLNVDCAELEE